MDDPYVDDVEPRKLARKKPQAGSSKRQNMKWLKRDSSPWIAPNDPKWFGLSLAGVDTTHWEGSKADILTGASQDWESSWKLLDDTFPSNLAIFNPRNFSVT